MSTETLETDVAWEPNGHLSDVALSVFADGEYTLLSTAMTSHLSICEECEARLGSVALRSIETAQTLGVPLQIMDSLAIGTGALPIAPPFVPMATQGAPYATSSIDKPQRRRIPTVAIGLALSVAILGAMPSFFAAPDNLSLALSVVRKVGPSLLKLLPHAANKVWNGSSYQMTILVWAIAGLLLALGFGIARKASKNIVANGGIQ